jgi:hypothetical protein
MLIVQKALAEAQVTQRGSLPDSICLIPPRLYVTSHLRLAEGFGEQIANPEERTDGLRFRQQALRPRATWGLSLTVLQTTPRWR